MRMGVIGAGAWGTALAASARRAGCEVVLWAREPEVVASVRDSHVNTLFLPDVPLDTGIRATGELTEAARADALLLVAPAQHMRATATALAPHLAADTPVVVCAKGIEHGTGALMTEVLAETMPTAPVAVLSGPSFAAEVARGLPAALSLGAEDAALSARLATALGTPHFRLYRTRDRIGPQIGGAVKNVIAIACGVAAGRALGDNARAALIARGLAEMTRLAVAKGGRAETMMGLSGLGDLTLTCNGAQSRNHVLGVALGEGRTLEQALAGKSSVAEGVDTAASVCALAAGLGVEMPICQAVNAVLHEGMDIDAAIAGLLARPAAEEAMGDG